MATPLRSNSSRSLTGSPGLPHKSAINLDATFDEDDEFDGQAVGTGGVTDMSSRVPGANKESEMCLVPLEKLLAMERSTGSIQNWYSSELPFVILGARLLLQLLYLSGMRGFFGHNFSVEDEVLKSFK